VFFKQIYQVGLYNNLNVLKYLEYLSMKEGSLLVLFVFMRSIELGCFKSCP
jgi:hypothetical protein